MGWILLGRFSRDAHNDIIWHGRKILELEKEIAKRHKISSEGAIVSNYSVKDLIGSSENIVSPIYVRQSPPSYGYELSDLAGSSSTGIVGVLCEGSEIKILDLKPIKPDRGNYTLWGRVSVEKSATCYKPGLD